MQHELNGGLLLIGWVFVFPQDALDHQPQLGADVFAAGPVDGQVLLQVFGEFMGDLFQGFITQFPDG